MTTADLQKALAIFAKYGAQDIAVAHDVIMVAHESLPLSSEDREALESMRWFIHEESWSHWV